MRRVGAREVYDPEGAKVRAELLADDQKVHTWLRRAKRLFRDLPPGTTIYYQEDTMHLMALSQTGDHFVQQDKRNPLGGEGSSTDAVVGSVRVPGSDCGAW